MTEAEESPIYEPGDVVYGADPYRGGEAARPWLIVSNHDGKPFHGEHYIALTLTTKSWHDGLIEIPETGWSQGGAPERSYIVPWGVQSIDREDVAHWQGRLERTLLEAAIDELVGYVRSSVGR